jgi:hypothetical protein
LWQSLTISWCRIEYWTVYPVGRIATLKRVFSLISGLIQAQFLSGSDCTFQLETKFVWPEILFTRQALDYGTRKEVRKRTSDVKLTSPVVDFAVLGTQKIKRL